MRAGDLLASTDENISHAQPEREMDWCLKCTVFITQPGGWIIFVLIVYKLMDHITKDGVSRGNIPCNLRQRDQMCTTENIYSCIKEKKPTKSHLSSQECYSFLRCWQTILKLAVQHISSVLDNQCIHVVLWKLREKYTYSHYSNNNKRYQKKDGKRKLISYTFIPIQ